MRKLSALLAIALLAGPMSAQSSIVFSTDDATDLQGAFSFSGTTSFETAAPVTFSLLPGESAFHSLLGDRYASDTKLRFGAFAVGTPDNPFKVMIGTAGLQQFGPFSGFYTNSGQPGAGGTTVYWRYFDWQDTGGAGGTFSGKFCFSTVEANCSSVPAVPLPAAAWLLLSGLGGLGFLGRRRRAA
jgi:hypothetical protein